MKKVKSDYDLFLDEVLHLVETRGILVQTIEKGTSILNEKHKNFLGSVYLKNALGYITHVYHVFGDSDGKIKYYDYLLFTQKEFDAMEKE